MERGKGSGSRGSEEECGETGQQAREGVVWWDKGKVEKGRKERETVSERKRMKVMRVLK